MTLRSPGAWRWRGALPRHRQLHPRTSSLLGARTQPRLTGSPVLASPHSLVRTPSRGATSHCQAGIFQLWGDALIPGNLAAGISEQGDPNAGPGRAAGPAEVLLRLLVTNTGEAKLQKGDKGVYVQTQVVSLGTDPRWASQ